MTTMAAILLLGACGSASRTMTVDASIEQIVVRVIVGGVKDVLRRWDMSAGRGIDWSVLRSVQLQIDGQPRTGVFAWTAAAARVAGYAVHRSGTESVAGVRGGVLRGSVEYTYRLRVRGFDIIRRTRIEDGRVSLLTDVYGSIGPRGELHHVRLVLVASDMGNRTRIRGTATGWSRIGDRCRLVGRIVGRVIARELDTQLLGRIQRGGIDLYRAGAIAEILK